tara:strand:- start:390 stop:860 length:471 start_codon:yes stop_codon:yes gene_type:complete
MIYETIPSKYLVKTEDIMYDEFTKLTNSNKYTPEQHFVDFICLTQQWLENSQDHIMECETSEEARRLGCNMVELNKFYQEIANSMGEYFKSQKLIDNFMDKNSCKELTKDIVNILKYKDGCLRLNCKIIKIYSESHNISKFLDSIGFEYQLNATQN